MLHICRGASLTSFAGLRYRCSRVASSVWPARISPVSGSPATARPWSPSGSAMRPALRLPGSKIRRLPAMLFRAARPLPVVDVPGFGEPFVEPVDRGDKGLRTFSWRPNGKIFVCPVLRMCFSKLASAL